MGEYDAFISYSHEADSQLAEALQTGLERLSKPWYRRRPFLRILRDETSFAASAHLSDRIFTALDSADHLVLLLSPESAASPWTDQEVEHWLETRGVDAMTFVVTRWALDDEPGVYGDLGMYRWKGTDVPPALRGEVDEPLAVDLRWVEDPASITLADEKFEDHVAEIAAAITGQTKDHLVGALVAMRARARILTGAVALGIAILLGAIAVSVPGWWAARQAADTARENEAVALAAERSALDRQVSAEAAATEAESQRRVAEQAAAEAETLLEAAAAAAAEADRLRAEAEAATSAAEEARDAAEADAAAATRLQAEAERLRAEADAAAAAAANLRDQALVAQAAAEAAAARARELQADAEASADIAQRVATSRRLGTISLSLDPAQSDAAALVGVEGICALAEAATCAQPGAHAAGSDRPPPTVESVDAILRAVAGRPGLLSYVHGFPDPELALGPRAAAVSPDGSLVAVAAGRECFSIDPNDTPGQVAIWTSVADDADQVLGLELGPRALELAADGTKLIAAGVCTDHGGLQIIDLVSGDSATAEASHLGEFSALSVAGDLVATIDRGGTATAWRLTDEPSFVEGSSAAIGGKGVAVHADEPTGTIVALSDTGALVRFGSADQSQSIWEVGSVGAAAFDQAGHRLAAVRPAGSIDLYELSDSGPILMASLEASAPPRAVRFDASGRLIAIARASGDHVDVWDLDREKRLGSFAAHADTAVFIADREQFIAAGAAEIAVWSLDRRSLRTELSIDSSRALSAAISGDGNRLALAQPDGVTVWRLTGSLAATTIPVETPDQPILRLSDDGGVIAVGAYGNQPSLELWDMDGPRRASVIDVDARELVGFDMTPDGKIVATLSTVNSSVAEVAVWDVSDPAEPRLASDFRISCCPVTIALRPDGAVVAIAAINGTAELYNAITGAVLATDLGRHPQPGAVSIFPQPIDHLAFYDAGTRLAVASFYTGTLVLWDVSDPKTPEFTAGPFVRAGDHTELSIAIAGDLPVIATQPGLQLWSRDLGTALAVGSLGSDDGWYAGYSRATGSLITVGDTVVQWGFAPSAWIEAACSLAARNLTSDEWATWIGGSYRATCRS